MNVGGAEIVLDRHSVLCFPGSGETRPKPSTSVEEVALVSVGSGRFTRNER
jgi:hypothetical protein